ncbi:DEAD/DEAH box helicase family protein [bacterium]|nr:DEAD/DEAH box helicase family protein [bacterium]NCT20237.1 DEAD/DEAH box helicase family protein [bacterium]
MSFAEKKIFAELLQYNRFYQYAGWQIADAGKMLFAQDKVEVVAYTDTSLECLVSDKTPEKYNVTLKMENNQLLTKCTCSNGQQLRICKHVVAAAITVQKILSAEIQKSWENHLLFTQNAPRKQHEAPQKVADYLLAFALYDNYGGWKIQPLTAPVAQIPILQNRSLPDWSNQEQMIEFLANTPTARAQFKAHSQQNFKPEACLNAPSQIVSLAQMIAKISSSSTYYADSSQTAALPGVLQILRDENFPLYAGQNTYGSDIFISHNRPLTISRESASVLLDIENSKDGGLRLKFHLRLGDALWKVTKKPAVVSQNPLWLMIDQTLIPGQENMDVEQVENINKASRIHIPAEEKDIFLENYLPGLAAQFTLTGSGINVREITEQPQPRLYLEEKNSILNVWLKFGYEKFEVPYESRIPETSSTYDVETATFTRIFRAADVEKAAFSQVSNFGLKRVTGSVGLFNLRAKVDVIDFLMHYVPKAVAAGFEVYGEENIKNVRINRHQPTISFNISSGIDWFDLNTVIQYGDLPVALKDMRRALKRRENYIKLGDGTLGEVPQEWLDRYKHLFNLGEETEDGLRFSNQQVTLLDQLLGESERVNSDDEFKRRRERLREFTSITPQSLPQNLTAELRPYQKAGVDWLHFLREYQFGGCLADDMGLGKTVQVLAFLQAIKEKNEANKAALVVVPKSLLTNWQREIEKFTPGLRALEYHGYAREKDTSVFDQYDLVITTYGVVIKDIELLRGYRFHYAILDESQAIKNPVSQSAKACRLLLADHRLVMTGTPVENSSFELWSQFAFLNPGLLGNLDYFKSEIGGPIERDANADTAQLLRKMVYPFILRRTKEQVAPELPPRTERVIYGEMEPAQRKIYTYTRERYRQALLGLIDGEGVNNARMKILEGLLRLRQICIHPLLVDKTYRGESAKFEMLLENIETLLSEGHKALIFSQFVETLKLLRAELDSRNIHYAYLDGQTNNRQEQVDAFQSDQALPLFLISLKAGGVGLNLTAADYVIHIDPWWNPAVEMQASDRAHRIGQDKPVFVYKYILRDSVEEKILQLQERKKNLVEQLITTDGSFFKNITAEDVKALFS